MILARIFKRKAETYDYRQTFIEFNRSLHIIKDRTSLAFSIMSRIYELIPTSAQYLFWINPEATRYLPLNVPQTHQDLYLLPDDGLATWLTLNEGSLTVSKSPEYANIFSENDRSVLRALGGLVVCPLRANNGLRGIIFLGARKDRKKGTYTGKELEMLSILLDNATLALDNLSYREDHAAGLKRLYRTDRLALVGQLAAGAAHEIRNPLTSIGSAIQYIQEDMQDAKKRKMMVSILSEVERINKILTGLLSFSRQNNPVKHEHDLVSMMEQTVGMLKTMSVHKRITYTYRYHASALPVVADGDQLKQLFTNILMNAYDAIENEGHIQIEICPVQVDHAPGYQITVADSGKGIDEAHQEKLFDPFFTTKTEGTGLGLSISYGIVQQHGGSVEIVNRPEGGALVTIQLPRGEIKSKGDEKKGI